ncbi:MULTISPECIES: DUF6049 family protein [unclassified Streptomyces]|uniref:DUF6049 family protein n=1 Tax=unclassified Streptomyces TaxID=2593676 RepID=UPI002E297EF6|nr:DUF6049 family protein [Streptomyces sp. NBC_00223]
MGEAAQAPGTPPPTPHRRLRRFTALFAGAALLTGLVQGVQATASQAKSPSGSRTAELTVDGLTPRIPAKGDTITVSGMITNNGKSKITQAHVGVRIGPQGPLDARSTMKTVSSRTGYVTAEDGYEVPDHTVDVPAISAGQSTPFTVKVPVGALDLGATGVYQLGVTLDGQSAAEPWEHVLGIKRTFLPWYDDGETAKTTKISYLWPLTDRPHIAPRGDTDSQQSPIFLDDDLTQELAPGGRLQEMVQLAKNLPVTWAIDPDLLASVEAMTKSYRVAGHDGDVTVTTPGTGSAVAKQWLNSLKTAVAGDQVVALPFGDTDLASLAHHGKGVRGSVDHLKVGASLGRITVDTILGVQSTANMAWPVDGAIDPSIVSVARGGGASRIIARSDTFPEDGDLNYTPNAARPVSGGITAVVADAPLSTAFTGDMLSAQNTNLAIQGFIAQSLMITMEAPEKQRAILVAPQRTPSVAQARALAEAIGAVDGSPWADSVSFDTTAKAHPDPDARHKVPSASAYPKSLRKHELSTDAFRQIQETQSGLNSFVTILTRQDRVTVPFGNAVLRSMSTSWRDDPHGADFRNAIGGYLQDLIDAVHILPKTTLTLSGRSGTIPVTVKNELSQPVKGLVLRLTSGTTIRLEIRDADQPIAIEGGHTRTLKFQTTASANGAVGITAHLYTEDGALYGKTVGFEVHINKVTDLVMLIIGAGLLLLVLAGVRIYRQRKRQAADEGGDGGSEGDGDNGGGDGDDGEAEGSDPGQPGDPAADTGQESPEPSPAGEKVDG